MYSCKTRDYRVLFIKKWHLTDERKQIMIIDYRQGKKQVILFFLKRQGNFFNLTSLF